MLWACSTVAFGQNVAPRAPTISQLAEQARLKRQTEDALRNAAPAVPGTAVAPVGLTIVPSTTIIKDPAQLPGAGVKQSERGKKSEEHKAQEEFIPGLIGIFSHQGKYLADMVEINEKRTFGVGQEMPSGWKIVAIDAGTVLISKPDQRSGGEKRITLRVNPR
jgi:hypothetical protein